MQLSPRDMRRLRDSQGWTQEELGHELGFGENCRSYICRMERSRKKRLTKKVNLKLQIMFGLGFAGDLHARTRPLPPDPLAMALADLSTAIEKLASP